jgi:hypothetical protein
MWPDEISREWCSECIGKMRQWFHLRYQLTVGKPVPVEALEALGHLQQKYPNWPFFRPERRSAEIADRVRRMVHHATRRACIELERMDREYRKRQEERTGSADPGAPADRPSG